MSEHNEQKKHTLKQKWSNRRFRHGSIATAITAIVIVAVILLNMGASVLGKKVTLSFDLTKNQVFQLTETSIDYLKTLDKDVEIDVLAKEEEFVAGGEYFIQANTVLKQYAQQSDRITLKYIDLTETPNYTNAYPSEELQTNSIIVKSGDRHEILTAMDIFNVESSYYGAYITSSQAEQAMTSAIVNVTTDEKVKITLISGFDEQDSTGFVNLLEKNNYEVISQTLLTEEIDSSSEVAIIYGPKRDYDEQAITKLNKYLENGGAYGKDIFYIAAPNQGETPNLNAFLESVGVKIGDGLVFETDPKKLLTTDSPFYATNEYVDDTYSQGIQNTNIPVSLPFSKPIEVLDQTKVKTLLQFSETSGVIPSDADENWSPSQSDINGPVPAMVVADVSAEGIEKPSHVSVAGSVIGFDTMFLSRSALNNSQYFLNMFKIFTEREDTVMIESKSIEGEELGINASQMIFIGGAFAIFLPLMIVVIGIVVWVKRRNR